MQTIYIHMQVKQNILICKSFLIPSPFSFRLIAQCPAFYFPKYTMDWSNSTGISDVIGVAKDKGKAIEMDGFSSLGASMAAVHMDLSPI